MPDHHERRRPARHSGERGLHGRGPPERHSVDAPRTPGGRRASHRAGRHSAALDEQHPAGDVIEHEARRVADALRARARAVAVAREHEQVGAPTAAPTTSCSARHRAARPARRCGRAERRHRRQAALGRRLGDRARSSGGALRRSRRGRAARSAHPRASAAPAPAVTCRSVISAGRRARCIPQRRSSPPRLSSVIHTRARMSAERIARRATARRPCGGRAPGNVMAPRRENPPAPRSASSACSTRAPEQRRAATRRSVRFGPALTPISAASDRPGPGDRSRVRAARSGSPAGC